MDAILTGSKTQIQNAVNAAHAMGGARRVKWLGGYSFEVVGVNATYHVDWQGHNARCDCPAGRHERICKHLACCWIWKMAKASVKGAA